MAELSHYLILSGILFAIGAAGVLLRRSLIAMLLSIEVMLNAVNLTFIAFGRFLDSADGRIIPFFVLAVAGAEAAVGLAIVIALSRQVRSHNPGEAVKALSANELPSGMDAPMVDHGVTGAGMAAAEIGATAGHLPSGSVRASVLAVLLGAVLIVGYYLRRAG